MAVNIKTLSESYPILSFQDVAEPLWASDAGRNANSGAFSGTFNGYYTNLKIEFGPMTKQQMTDIKAIFEVPIVNITFPNSHNNGANYTEDFYGTAITPKLDYWNGKYKSFSLDLVAVRRRNDI